MTSFISILAATDFSVDGNNAVRRAALLAHEHGARLHILHVLNPAGCKPLRDWFSPTLDLDLKAAQARDALRRLAVEILGAYDLTASVEVAVGNPFETLMKASEHVDLVVLGRRGHGHLKGLLVGRTVDRMLRICRRPVLVVKTSVQGSYRRVLVPIDFTAASGAAIRVADRMRREMSMHVFHALNSKREAVLRDADVPEHRHQGDPPDGRRSDQRPHASQGRQTRPGQRVHELMHWRTGTRCTRPAIRFFFSMWPLLRSAYCWIVSRNYAGAGQGALPGSQRRAQRRTADAQPRWPPSPARQAAAGDRPPRGVVRSRRRGRVEAGCGAGPREPRDRSPPARRLRRGRRERTQGSRIARRPCGLPDEVGQSHLVLGRALLERGRLDEAEKSFEAADAVFEQMESVGHRAGAWVALGDLASRRGDDGEAARRYRSAAEALQDIRF